MQRIQTHRINETTYQLLIVSVVLSRVSLTVRDLRYKIRNWIRINLPSYANLIFPPRLLTVPS